MSKIFFITFFSLEIRELDGKLQVLVYENYSKFIDSYPIFVNMNESCMGMYLQSKLLDEKVGVVDNTTGAVDVYLEDRRERLEKLTGMNRLLAKVYLFFIFVYSFFLIFYIFSSSQSS